MTWARVGCDPGLVGSRAGYFYLYNDDSLYHILICSSSDRVGFFGEREMSLEGLPSVGRSLRFLFLL